MEVELDSMSELEISTTKPHNSHGPTSAFTGDSSGNIDRLLKQQVVELKSVLTDQHARAMRAVEEHVENIRHVKADLSELRAENQRLRQQLHAAGLSSSIPPWHGMGGTGESSSSESRPRGAATDSTHVVGQVMEDRHARPAPPSAGDLQVITMPNDKAPKMVSLPGSTTVAFVESQMEKKVAPRQEPSNAAYDRVVDFSDADFRSVVPSSNNLNHHDSMKTCEGTTTEVTFINKMDSEGEFQDDPERELSCELYNKESGMSNFEIAAKKMGSSIYLPQGHVVDSGGPRPVFADAAAMKEKLRAALHAPEYNVADFYHERGFWQKIARDHHFENFTLFVIAANSIWIAVDTDYNDSDVLIEADIGFFFGENAFCVYFAFEWIVRFMAFKEKRNCLKDSWFVFDSALVAMMVLETWVISAIIAMTSSKSSGGLGNASILRLLRLLRLTRMARMARLLRAMPELMILIKGMAVATRSVFFTLCLLVLIIYLFAIAFTTLTKGTPLGDKYFKKVHESMGTLLLAGILPDHEESVNEVGAAGIGYAILFMFFMLLGSLTVMNMLVGVIVQVVSIVSAVEKEQMVVNFVKIQLQTLLNSSGIDANGDNQISKSEFETLLQKPEAARALQDVGVDVIGLVDFTDFIFKDDMQLSFPNFMEMVLQLRGSNTATVKDIVDFRKVFVQELARIEERITSKIQTALTTIGDSLESQARQAHRHQTQKSTMSSKVRGYNTQKVVEGRLSQDSND